MVRRCSYAQRNRYRIRGQSHHRKRVAVPSFCRIGSMNAAVLPVPVCAPASALSGNHLRRRPFPVLQCSKGRVADVARALCKPGAAEDEPRPRQTNIRTANSPVMERAPGVMAPAGLGKKSMIGLPLSARRYRPGMDERQPHR